MGSVGCSARPALSISSIFAADQQLKNWTSTAFELRTAGLSRPVETLNFLGDRETSDSVQQHAHRATIVLVVVENPLL